nr:hypothetical protein [uncultured Methanoregula sp.]
MGFDYEREFLKNADWFGAGLGNRVRGVAEWKERGRFLRRENYLNKFLQIQCKVIYLISLPHFHKATSKSIYTNFHIFKKYEIYGARRE